MRIWDINPGYLNRGSLLGEHRELHGLLSIIDNNKTGYRKHPESIRWLENKNALLYRHELLITEFHIRNYKDNTPINLKFPINYPKTYIDNPRKQFDIVEQKYKDKEAGRIAIPKSTVELWSHHKYSIMAHDVNSYKKIGRFVSSCKNNESFNDIFEDIKNIFLIEPSYGNIRNSLLHMWGYISKFLNINPDKLSNLELLEFIRKTSIQNNILYITNSTALNELEIWINKK